MNKYSIYDDLIEGIDDSVKVTKVICGLVWTVVETDALNLGFAMTTGCDTIARQSINYIGMSVKEAAYLVKSWNYLEAGIGMAAINAYYNTDERMNRFGYLQQDDSFCTFGFNLEDKNIAMIGHLRYDEHIFDKARNLYIMEISPKNGDYPAAAAEYIVPECDIVIITGSAFINKTLPRLLELSENAEVIITGPSSPMNSILTEKYGISRVAGFIPKNNPEILNMVSAGCIKTPYPFGKRFYIDL